MNNFDVIEDVLRVLSKKPMDRTELARHIGNNHSREQVKTALLRLKDKGFITAKGPLKHYVYTISPRGKEILDKLDIEEFRANLTFEISKYIRSLSIGVDT